MSKISRTMKSVLLTKGLTVKHNANQKVSVSYSMPDEATRVLIGSLLYEETLETLSALGLCVEGGFVVSDSKIKPDLMKAVDGACDTIYVATGILAACGVPDNPHMKEVIKANHRKFPDGIAILDANTGKYLKPPGWKGPDHQKLRIKNLSSTDMKKMTEKLIHKFKKKDKK